MAQPTASYENIGALTAVLKEAWSPISDATETNQLIVDWRTVKETTKGGFGWENDQTKIWVPFKTAINRQAGPVSETHVGKSAGKSTRQRAYFSTVMQDGVMGITSTTVEMCKGDPETAVNILVDDIKDTKLAVTKELAQQHHMAGDASYGYMPAADNDATFSVAAPCFAEVGDVINILDTDKSTLHVTNDDAVTTVGDPTWSAGLPTVVVTIRLAQFDGRGRLDRAFRPGGWDHGGSRRDGLHAWCDNRAGGDLPGREHLRRAEPHHGRLQAVAGADCLRQFKHVVSTPRHHVLPRPFARDHGEFVSGPEAGRRQARLHRVFRRNGAGVPVHERGRHQPHTCDGEVGRPCA